MDTLMDASREWATRPDDQRYESLNAMYLATFLAAQESMTVDVGAAELRVTERNGTLALNSPAGPLTFSHYSFGQLGQRVGAPVGWLRDNADDAPLAAEVFNKSLARAGRLGEDAQLYYRTVNGANPRLLAVTSQKYGRIFNHEVIGAVKNLPGNWVSPLSMIKPGEIGRPAVAEDLKYGTNIQIGQQVSKKRALYASDKDMFLFFVDGDRRIEDGSDGGLARGFFVTNSEVGDATFSITRFLYRYVCMNNIVWGAQQVERVSVKHAGRGARGRAFDKLGIELKSYAEASADEDENRIKAAQALILGGNLEDVQDLVFADKRITSKKNVSEAYELATVHESEDGNPNTAWGLAQGLTRLSQMSKFTDERVLLDEAAGKVLALAA